MNKYLILCVDDEPEVLNSVLQDLAIFEENFIVEGAESVDEAKQVTKEMEQDGIKLALILCDHIMPEKTGIDFLIELNQHDSTKPTRKLLLTGQAGLEAEGPAEGDGGQPNRACRLGASSKRGR